ncbi:SDR family NAD(P)-dependent oxidoreductase [Chachezhania sediminis]|uniref:SDR family NAD(P)-dependent oxidoreductase n=1 Tax=Chachezhania sediminis TaxID=2599291 RepID=UPI00131A7A41|nr:glucose 1-dehydrogenase [Chachezhania sediminis]
MKLLENKVALITGGGSGFGKAGSIAFADHGAAVCVADINADNAAAVAEEITAAGGRAIAVAADVADERSCADMVARTVDAFGGLDVVWANAGVAQPKRAIEDMPLAEFQRIMTINTQGVWLTLRAAARALKASGSGSAIVTSSVSGVKGRPGLSAYHASKGAVIMITRGLAAEWAPFNARVNCICPVAADTPMLPTFFESLGDPKELVEKSRSNIPLGRLATPKDIVDCALYLASEMSAMMTGSTLHIDGGVLAT